MPAGQGLLHQNAFAVQLGVIQHRQLGLLVEVVGNHRAVTRFEGQQAACDGLAGQAEGADLALALEFGEGLVDAAVAQDGDIVAVRVHQQQVDEVGLQALEAALHGEAGVCRGEVEARLAVFELFADLADDHPLLALAA